MYKHFVAVSLFLVGCDALVTEIPLRRVATSAPISRLRRAYRQSRGPLSKAFNTDPVYLDGTLGLFVGDVSLGTPPQPFLVAFDTGSADFWVVDADCRDVNCLGQPKSGHEKTRFRKNASTTFVNDGTSVRVEYDTGVASGVLAHDTLRFGNVVDVSQPFGVMSQLDDDIGYMPVDGFFGLGWPDLSAFDVSPPVFNALSQLDQAVFSVWLDNHPVPSATYTGSITFGGLDTRHCDSNWMWTPLEQYQSRYNYWIFHLDSFSLGQGDDFVVQDQCSTDTGVSWINAPSHIVDAIASRTNAEYQFKDDIYTVICDATSLPDFTFTAAGGATLTISPDVYLLKIDDKRNVCAIEVYATPFMDGWLIGDTVNRAYCHGHDVGRKRIGFAKSIHSEKN